MSSLKFRAGAKEVDEAIRDGRGIVHFLTNPFTACAVEAHNVVIAANFGDNGLESKIWSCSSNVRNVFRVPYMANQKVLIRSTSSPMGLDWVNFQRSANALKSLRGFAILEYDGDQEGIVGEFVAEGYSIVDFTIDKMGWYSKILEERRDKIERMRGKIEAFYRGG